MWIKSFHQILVRLGLTIRFVVEECIDRNGIRIKSFDQILLGFKESQNRGLVPVEWIDWNTGKQQMQIKRRHGALVT